MRRRLLAWYRASRRDLPWRRTRDPYRIWLSETMLQQTRVESVVPYYERFLERFPSIEALADADEQDVLREWAGLGYYARARNLKHAAELVVRDHGGRLPRNPEELRALPGIGRYTAGALRSIAFGERAPVVDGNVRRVFSRWLGASALGEAALWALAAELVPEDSPDEFNQALMELGARICTPRAPRCHVCPVRAQCSARREGRPEAYPARKQKPAPVAVTALAGVLERTRPERALLVMRRPPEGLLGGLWELPTVEAAGRAALVDALHQRTGLLTRAGEPLGEVRHLFSHRELKLRLVRLERVGGRLRRGAGRTSPARWCSPDDLAQLPLSTLMKKSLRLIRRYPPDHVEGASGRGDD